MATASPARATRDLLAKPPALPSEMDLEYVAAVLTHASYRKDDKRKKKVGLHFYVQQIGKMHTLNTYRVRVVNEQVVARCNRDGRLFIETSDGTLTPYTLASAISLYEWVYRAGQKIMLGRPYGHPPCCVMQKLQKKKD